ncbi:hypothetical protein ACVWXM_003446 [Bradyrhizobium sp. GM7.3]
MQWVQHIDGLARLLPCDDRLDEFQAVAGDAAVDLDVLLDDLVGARIGGLRALQCIDRREARAHLVQGPFQIDRGRPRHHERVVGALQAGVGSVLAHRQRHAVSCGRADQWRTAHQHVADGEGRVLA